MALIEKSLEQRFGLFTERLLIWFRSNARKFPWRETRDPYRIMVAEMMLQKTTSRQAEEIFSVFLGRFPSVEDLAKAPLSNIEETIRPLGLGHVRATRLKKLAKEIVGKHGGRMPRDRKTLLSLPGVGEYIANAVLCLAYDEDLPLLDTNQLRVFDRVFGIRSSKKRARTDSVMWRLAEDIIPKGRGREFGLAVLDFASLVCRAKNPKCAVCPMNEFCLYFVECRASD
jgi:A/G-specific adenine glycosylase